MNKSTIITQRVEALRQWMRAHALHAYFFPSTDPHSGEYVPDYWKTREWISGFNGSAGTAVVTLTRAVLWTDSRYWLAADEQLADTPFEVVRCGSNLVKPLEVAEWLAMEEGDTDEDTPRQLGLNGWTTSDDYAQELDGLLRYRGWAMQSSAAKEEAPESELWTDRPPLPLCPIEIQPMQYAGQSAAEKLDAIRATLSGADAIVITQLDEIAWTLNLRGCDIHCTPVFVSYLVVLPHTAFLYVNPAQLTSEVAAYLQELHVETRPYERIAEDFLTETIDQAIDEAISVQYDPSVTNHALATAIRNLYNDRLFYEYPSPVPAMRAIKNEAEQAGFRLAMQRDGVAMVKFLRWLEERLRDERLEMRDEAITEVGVDRKLTALRAEQPGFRSLSFDTIAGYGSHAAIVHYEATPETDIPLEPHGLLLLDSGGQYDCGTTDITRTIALGPLTDEERRDYTLVLKGHIRLAMAVFPDGTSGTQLDVLARYAMWQDHKNYGHGTGHGVGSYLSVHEGPHQFRMNYVPAPLHAGMTITIEPGIYIAGSHGVRIENTMLIVKDEPSTSQSWLRLEPLTLCPIDTTPVLLELMASDEIAYLNRYHARVRDELLPLLRDEADRAWLIAHAAPLSR